MTRELCNTRKYRGYANVSRNFGKFKFPSMVGQDFYGGDRRVPKFCRSLGFNIHMYFFSLILLFLSIGFPVFDLPLCV